MNSFDALSLLDSEGVSSLQFDHLSLNIDAPDTNPALFYATFDGKFIIFLNLTEKLIFFC